MLEDVSVVDPLPQPVCCSICHITVYQLTPLNTLVLNPAIARGYGSAARAVVALTLGENDINGGAGETVRFSVCPRCFVEKLKPLLEQLGAAAITEPWIV